MSGRSSRGEHKVHIECRKAEKDVHRTVDEKSMRSDSPDGAAVQQFVSPCSE